MAIQFTPKQQKVLDAAGHNILVSAAAGSGKTAVLVERIIRMISRKDNPLNIDRLLVVTFTRAAAAEMRERIAAAVTKKLEDDPDNKHLQKQETLLHNAQITTIDSFCSYLLHNNFADIGLDPGFRQMDAQEAQIVMKDVMKDFLDAEYARSDEEFSRCVEYFCPGSDDTALEDLIFELYSAADSHPFPKVWLTERLGDYEPGSVEDILESDWMEELLRSGLEILEGIEKQYEEMLRICEMPDGPAPYAGFLAEEKNLLLKDYLAYRNRCGRDLLSRRGEAWEALRNASHYAFSKIPAVRSGDAGKEKRELVKSIRDDIKERLSKMAAGYCSESLETALFRMSEASGPLRTLIELTMRYAEAFDSAKRDKNAIDFSDLERLALQIMIEADDEGNLKQRSAALSYRQHYDEILIDEYQDSNEVQELLLSVIAGDADFSGENKRYARFMVGDVKQSIYRFRGARPEIFAGKFDTYQYDDPQCERIDLDQNFRSRSEVLDSVNFIFSRIMRREVGGVGYGSDVSLKVGASYPRDYDEQESPYKAELILLTPGRDEPREKEDVPDEESAPGDSKHREALVAAQKIREIVGVLPITDVSTGRTRPAMYKDIVILLRSSGAWNDAFREVFEKEGIPLYVDYKAGYFATEEIRQILDLLKVIDNPVQDIPLYGVLNGYFGGFDQDELALIRAAGGKERYYDALTFAAGRSTGEGAAGEEDTPADISPELAEKCGRFLDKLDGWRYRATVMSIHELISELIYDSGYDDYMTALPGGTGRLANLESLLVKAADFEKTTYTGLFRFLRYISQMKEYEVDFGEVNISDEKSDVVRIMTIHKSKGLEFPVCIVAGLGSRFAFRSKDTSGMMLTEQDLGIGIDYYNPQLRVRTSTLRKDAIVQRIMRDAMGEELRVLYVALTRAKEKLILIGTASKAAPPGDGQQQEGGENALLPPYEILSSPGYLELILRAVRGLPETERYINITTVSSSDLKLNDTWDQIQQELRRNALERAVLQAAGEGPGAVREQFSWRYPREDMSQLYTKTSVSELKRAWNNEGSGAGADTEAAGLLYSQEPVSPYLPQFITGGEEGDSQDENAQGAGSALSSGARRGSAVHSILEKIDFAKWQEPQAVTREDFLKWKDTLLSSGEVPKEYETVLDPAVFLPFLHSDLAGRMAAADKKGLLCREQPFVLGIDARRLNADFPEDETVLIQGIIDAFFIEDDRIVILDYKTDRVRTEQVLKERYRVQLEYYAEALERILNKPVKEKIIYSFALRRQIPLT